MRAFDHWLTKDYLNPNWWQNEIGIPKPIAEFLLLMGDEVDPKRREAALRIIRRAKIGMTGQNRIWLSGVVLLRSMLQNDPALARTARDTIMAEIQVSTGEGLQADSSFHQHGPQLQFGNYGLGFAIDTVKWTKALRGTSLATPPEKVALLRNFLLFGQGSVIWRGSMDVNACGRQLFPDAQEGKAGTLGVLLENMAVADPEYAKDYRTVAKRCQADQTTTDAENRFFPRSDYMVHRDPGYFASVRFCSKRVIGAESGNGENLQGYHLGDGALYVYRSGNEYQNIFPVWNWRKIPGITARQSSGDLPRLKWEGYRLDTDFAGGVSDGRVGAAALDFDRDGVKARKAWFFFPERIVCLGAGISAKGNDPVVTSVAQCLVRGGKDSVPPMEKSPDGKLRWAWNDGIGYVLFDAKEASAKIERRTGSWKSIFLAGPDAPVERNVFSLDIDHGANPENATYAYALLPGATEEATRQFSVAPDTTILANTPSLQAVRHGDCSLAVFYAPGRLDLPGGRYCAVSAPCLLILRDSGNNLLATVADPTQKLETLSVDLNGTKIDETLPVGPAAGSSVWVHGPRWGNPPPRKTKKP